MPRHLLRTPPAPLPPMPKAPTTQPVPVTLDPEAVLDPTRTAPAELIERLRSVERRATTLHDPQPVAVPDVNVGDRVRICITAVVTDVSHADEHTSYRYVPTDEWPNGAYSIQLPTRPPEDTTVSVEVL